MVEHHIGSATFGCFHHPSHQIARAVVQRVMRSDFASLLALLVRACCGQHSSPGRISQLDSSRRHSAASGMNQKSLASLKLAHIKQRMGCRHPASGEGSGVLDRHLIGHTIHMAGRSQAKLCVAAVKGGPDDAQLPIKIPHPRIARVRSHAAHGRIHHHPIAHSHPLHLAADFRHPPRHIHPGDMRQRKPRHGKPPVPLNHIQPIQSSRLHSHDNISGHRLRVAHLPVLQHLRPSRCFIKDCFHFSPPTIALPPASQFNPRTNGWVNAAGWRALVAMIATAKIVTKNGSDDSNSEFT